MTDYLDQHTATDLLAAILRQAARDLAFGAPRDRADAAEILTDFGFDPAAAAAAQRRQRQQQPDPNARRKRRKERTHEPSQQRTQPPDHRPGP